MTGARRAIMSDTEQEVVMAASHPRIARASNDDLSRSGVERFGANHREAAHLVALLRGSTTVGEAWLALTQSLRELGAHFREEEATGGLFDWFDALLPEREHDVLHLRAQHFEMLSTLDDMVHRRGPLADDDALIVMCGRLAELLDAHEDLEISVLGDAARANRRATRWPDEG